MEVRRLHGVARHNWWEALAIPNEDWGPFERSRGHCRRGYRRTNGRDLGGALGHEGAHHVLRRCHLLLAPPWVLCALPSGPTGRGARGRWRLTCVPGAEGCAVRRPSITMGALRPWPPAGNETYRR